MATVRWVGKAQSTAQVVTGTVTAYDAATTYSATINSKVVSVVGVTSVNATAAALTAALVAFTEPEFQKITFTNSTAAIICTANTEGEPFTITFAAAGGTGSISQATTTANSSPNDANNATNYSGGSLPTNSDDLVFDSGDVDVLWNLGALSGVTLTSFTRREGYTGTIGLPEYNTSGSEPYLEYHATEFAISATTATIEQPSTDDIEQIKWNAGSAQTTLTIRGNGQAGIGSEQFRFRGTHASNVVNLQNASCVIAPIAGTTAVVATLNALNSTVRCGGGVTLTTVNNDNSTIEANSSITTLNQREGGSVTTTKGTGAITTATLDEGTLIHNSSGTITTLTIGTDAVADFSQANHSTTVTNAVNIHSGGQLLGLATRPTLSNGFTTVRCRLSEVQVDFGPGRTYTVS